MWYVVQTMSGQEGQVKDFIERTVESGLVQEVFIPRYEVMKRIKGLWRKRTEVLMPGYVFVVTKSPSKLKAQLRGVPRFTRLLGNDDMFTPLGRPRHRVHQRVHQSRKPHGGDVHRRDGR